MRYIVTAYFESQDRYTVEADSEEEAIEKCQSRAFPFDSEGGRINVGPVGYLTYARDAEVECVDWDAVEMEE